MTTIIAYHFRRAHVRQLTWCSSWDVISNPKINGVIFDQFVTDEKTFKVKNDTLTVHLVAPEVYAPFLENFGATRWFRNVKFRQAWVHASDRDAIINSV